MYVYMQVCIYICMHAYIHVCGELYVRVCVVGLSVWPCCVAWWSQASGRAVGRCRWSAWHQGQRMPWDVEGQPKEGNRDPLQTQGAWVVGRWIQDRFHERPARAIISSRVGCLPRYIPPLLVSCPVCWPWSRCQPHPSRPSFIPLH